MRLIEKPNTKIAVFDSPDDYHDFHVTNIRPDYRGYANKDMGNNWCGGPYQTNLNKLKIGDTNNLAKVQAILDKVDVSGLLASNMPLLEQSIAGFVPNVAAYLAGQPETMFDLIESDQASPVTPIRVVLETTVSAAVSLDELVRRGIGMCAFVMALNTVRPVELHVLGVQDFDSRSGACYGHMVKVFDRHIDLARAMFMLTDPGFARSLHFPSISELQNRVCNIGVWPFRSQPGAADYETGIREALELSPQDVFFAGGYITNKLMLNDPIAWVNQEVKKYSGT